MDMNTWRDTHSEWWVGLYLAMASEWNLGAEYREYLDNYFLANPTAGTLLQNINTHKGQILGKDGSMYRPMYQHCSVRSIKDSVQFGLKFWVSYRSHGEYKVALIQPDNRSI